MSKTRSSGDIGEVSLEMAAAPQCHLVAIMWKWRPSTNNLIFFQDRNLDFYMSFPNF